MNEKLRQAIPEKLYYRIGEVARITGVKPHVLRYWESEFELTLPGKDQGKQRLYRGKDVDLLLTIKRLLYKERYSIAGAKKKLMKGSKQAAGQDSADKEELKKALTDIKAELLDIKDLLK